MFSATNTVAVSTGDLAKTTPAEFGAAVLAAVGDQLTPSSNPNVVSVQVMVAETVEMVVETGPTYSPGSTFLLALGQAACTGMVGGVCTATGGTRRSLAADELIPLTAEPPHISTHGRRRLGTTVTLDRSYDFGASTNSSTPVSDLVEGALGGMGVEVTDATTTALSAESTVTSLGDASTSAVTDQLGDDALSGALAMRLPAVDLDVSSPLVITPPAAPPPPEPAPPGYPPAVPFSTQPKDGPGRSALVGLGVMTGLLGGLLVVFIVGFVLWKRRRFATIKVGGSMPAHKHVVQPVPAMPTVDTPARFTAIVPAGAQSTTAVSPFAGVDLPDGVETIQMSVEPNGAEVWPPRTHPDRAMVGRGILPPSREAWTPEEQRAHLMREKTTQLLDEVLRVRDEVQDIRHLGAQPPSRQQPPQMQLPAGGRQQPPRQAQYGGIASLALTPARVLPAGPSAHREASGVQQSAVLASRPTCSTSGIRLASRPTPSATDVLSLSSAAVASSITQVPLPLAPGGDWVSPLGAEQGEDVAVLLQTRLRQARENLEAARGRAANARADLESSEKAYWGREAGS